MQQSLLLIVHIDFIQIISAGQTLSV